MRSRLRARHQWRRRPCWRRRDAICLSFPGACDTSSTKEKMRGDGRNGSHNCAWVFLCRKKRRSELLLLKPSDTLWMEERYYIQSKRKVPFLICLHEIQSLALCSLLEASNCVLFKARLNVHVAYHALPPQCVHLYNQQLVLLHVLWRMPLHRLCATSVMPSQCFFHWPCRRRKEK